MDKSRFSYEAYLEFISQLPNLHMHEEGKRLLERLYNKETTPSRYAPVLYILDYAQNKYLYVDEACYELFGFTAKQWVEEGVESYLQKWHPSDFSIWNNHVFPENMRFLQSMALERYPDLVFSSNYRTLTAKGDYITILQRSSYIPSTIVGKPLGTIGVAIDISHFKNDLSVVHTIEEIKENNQQIESTLLYKRTYAVEDLPAATISPRELDVLKQLAQGFSSKQIAHNLFLSINTVNNHRKNMLNKTGCKSSTELLNYAMRHGYL